MYLSSNLAQNDFSSRIKKAGMPKGGMPTTKLVISGAAGISGGSISGAGGLQLPASSSGGAASMQQPHQPTIGVSPPPSAGVGVPASTTTTTTSKSKLVVDPTQLQLQQQPLKASSKSSSCSSSSSTAFDLNDPQEPPLPDSGQTKKGDKAKKGGLQVSLRRARALPAASGLITS